MNERLITELVRKIDELQKRVDYLEAVEKNTFSTVAVSDYLTAEGGVHVGGTSDPGTDDLLVDGLTTSKGYKSIRNDKTIASGAIDGTDCTFIGVSVESGTADNLDNITGGVDGQIVVLTARVADTIITVRDDSVSSGNICTSGAASRPLERASTGCDMLMLIYNALASEWQEIGYGANAA